MLQSIRDFVSGWMAIAFVVVLIIPFAFFGINYYFDGGGNILTAKVNGSDISTQEYQRSYQNNRQQWQFQFNMPISAAQEILLKQNTIDALVERELLKQVNVSADIRPGDRQVMSTIFNMEPFQGIDGFDTVIFEQTLAQIGLTSKAFEEQMRMNIASAQLQNALFGTEFVTVRETENLLRLNMQTRDFSYAILNSDTAKDAMKITDEDVVSNYEQQSQRYMEPERVRIAYVELSLQKFANEVKATEEELLSYYENNKANYGVEEQRSFKQLFISKGKDEDISAEKLSQITNRMEALQTLIKSGFSFEEAAEKDSTEDNNNVEVSTLDYMTKGIMEAKLDEVLFNLEDGSVSGIIETDNGFQITKVTEIKGWVYGTYEDVQEDVEKDYRLAKAELQFFEDTDKLATLAYEHPDSLDVVSEELNLTVFESTLFSRLHQGNNVLLKNPSIIAASFSDDILLAGNNSESIEIEDNRLLVLRVIEHKPTHKKPLDEVRDSIVTQLKFEQARDAMRKKGEIIISALRDNSTKEGIAEQYSIEWKEATGIKRNDTEINQDILTTVFRSGRLEKDGKPIYSGGTLNSGDYVVAEVSRVRNSDISETENDNLKLIQNQLTQEMVINTRRQFIKNIKQQADIKIFSNNL